MNKLHQIIMVLVFATGGTNWSEHPEGIDHWTPEVHCADASIPIVTAPAQSLPQTQITTHPTRTQVL